MTELYIEENYIELSENIQYSINKTYEDLSYPTKIKNDFSKTIKIPLTEQNFKTFGKYTNSQYVPVANIKELNFDPNSKLSFKLYNNGLMIFEGYVKFTKCYYSVKDKYIECTLNSNVNSYFNKLSNLTLCTTVDDNFNITESNQTVADILFNNIYKTKIDRNYIYDCWTFYPEYLHNGVPIFKNKQRSIIPNKARDIIGFALTNRGLYDDFNSKKRKFNGTLNEDLGYNQYENTLFKQYSFSPTTSELRSYYQRPYVYVSALFDFYKQMSDKVGTKLFLDPLFFNENNPYYADSVLTCNLLSTNAETLTNSYTVLTNTYDKSKNFITKHSTNLSGDYIDVLASPLSNNPIKGDTYIDAYKCYYDLPDGYNQVTGTLEFDFTLHIQIPQDKLHNNYIKYVKGRDIVIRLVNGDDLTQQLSDVITLECGNVDDGFNNKISTDNLTNIENITESGNLLLVNKHIILKINQSVKAPYKIAVTYTPIQSYPNSATIDRSDSYSNVPVDLYEIRTKQYNSLLKNVECSVLTTIKQYNLQRTFITSSRSNSYLTLERVLGKDFKVSDFILNYCKMFNLKIVENNGYINILTTNTYFKYGELLDVSDKIDRSIWEINQNRFENNFISFDYTDKDTFISNDYKKLYGINFGAKKIKTNYQFNNNTQDIIKKYNVIIDSVLSYNKIDVDESYVIEPTKELPSLYTVNGEELKDVTDYSALAFIHTEYTTKNGYKYTKLPTFNDYYNSELVNVYITDDSQVQISSGEYYWDNTLSKTVKTYITLSNFIEKNDKKYSMLFEKPYQLYSNSKTSEYLNDCNFIYGLFWDKYLNDRYFGNDLTDNVAGDSKVLTTKMFLTENDIHKLTFKDIYCIDGSYWLLNKIIDYNPNSKESTKVEFVKLQNIENYKTNLLPKSSNNYIYTPNTYYEFGYKEQFFEVNIYTDYDAYILFYDTSLLRILRDVKEDGVRKIVFTLKENTSTDDISTEIYVRVADRTSEKDIVLTTILQHPKNYADDVDFYATQYTANLSGANSTNNTDNVGLYATDLSKVVLDSVPSNLKVELPIVAGKRIRRHIQILITSLKNIKSTNYFIINYVDNGVILRSILFKVIVKSIRNIKKPIVTVTVPSKPISKPVITRPVINTNISI